MHNLLDRLDDVSSEIKDMQPGFSDSEKIALRNLRQMAQNILKKTYKAERGIISADIKKSGIYALSCISKILISDSAFTKNLAQNADQSQSRRDSKLKAIDLAYGNMYQKINTMNTCEVFEFLDTFSKKNLHSTSVSVRHLRKISVIVELIPKIDVNKTYSKRIEVKLVPVNK